MFCSFLTKAPWYALKGQFLDPPTSQDSRHWWSAILIDYLDADKDGKVTIQEFYDIKIVKLLRRIFDGFDKTNDGVVDKSEASLTSLLRPAFFRSLVEEIFPVLDVNKDNTLSLGDVTICRRGPDSWCGGANTTADVCVAIFQDYHISCDKAFATYLPLVDT